MLPVISVWLALFSSLFRSRWALHLQVLAVGAREHYALYLGTASVSAHA